MRKALLMYQQSLTTNTVPLYATASSKAWLATLPSDQAVEFVMKNGGFSRASDYGPKSFALSRASW